jgi:hypothetical protein
VSKHLNQSETCPICREPFKNKKLLPNRVIWNMIEDAEVYCFSYNSSHVEKAGDFCEWFGQLKNGKKHYDKCQFVKTKCPHIGCEDIFLRRSLPEHIENCLHRLIPCKWCRLRKKVDNLDAHLLACPKRPVPCSNNCLDENGIVQSFRPHEINNHRSTICPLELIDCKFATAGCQKKIQRRHMSLHENDAGVHLNCLLNALQTAQTKICQMDKVIKSLISDGVTAELIFYVNISQLNSNITSHTIDVSGHKFYLELKPNNGWHLLYLELVEDPNRDFSSFNAKVVFTVVSFIDIDYAREFNHTYLGTGGRGFVKYIPTRVLENEGFIDDDGEITLKAKINIRL